MIEIFKTDVSDRQHAALLVEIIHQKFPAYTANFDLSDCDNVLRIHSSTGIVTEEALIHLLAEFGFTAALLPDELPVISNLYRYALFKRAMLHTH